MTWFCFYSFLPSLSPSLSPSFPLSLPSSIPPPSLPPSLPSSIPPPSLPPSLPPPSLSHSPLPPSVLPFPFFAPPSSSLPSFLLFSLSLPSSLPLTRHWRVTMSQLISISGLISYLATSRQARQQSKQTTYFILSSMKEQLVSNLTLLVVCTASFSCIYVHTCTANP